MIISIAGNILSGKTTLAKKISSLYDFAYIPFKRNELNFLDSFFENIPEYFFATQTSFLVSKVLEINEQCKTKTNIVIDRSLHEDINIFAQLWMDNYNIDSREKLLYINLANYLLTTVPKTDIYIHCKGEQETILERFDKRPHRTFENKYPPDYIQQLSDRYNSIIFPNDAAVIEIDTNNIDFRDDTIVINIMSHIFEHLNQKGNEQLSFFEDSNESKINSELSELPYIKILNRTPKLFWTDSTFRLKKKRIYLAAPFTEFATDMPKTDETNQLFDDMYTGRDYNIIPIKYQKFLNKIKKLLSCDGEFDVILPHKEENNWGKSYITNGQIIDAMLNNMKKSDLIVAIISNSIGVHMELAMMAIQNKPMILIIVDNLTKGFYAKGFKNKSNVLVINVPTIYNSFNALNSEKAMEFIRSNLYDEKMD